MTSNTPSARDNFAKRTIQALMLRVAGVCSRPECRRMTIVPNPNWPSDFLVTGRAAHITAASPNGPRFDASLTPVQRRAAENGIWLCADCADLIDKRGGEGFETELLKSWKARAEDDVANSALLGSVAQRPVWLDKLSTPHYINLPRIMHLSTDQLSARSAAALKGGFRELGYIGEELYEVKHILRRLTIRAIDVEQLIKPERQLREGLAVSFYRACRTLNGSNTNRSDVETFSAGRSPQIYCKAHGFKYVMPYDPIWITTNTAVATMRSGNATLAGFALVKRVELDKRVAVCTPLAFGLPDVMGLFG